jgi:gliding-associated putative ABC transporter substrate-binding component GldG
MFTSQYSRRIAAPVAVNINEIRKKVKDEDFSERSIPVAYLLEGSFTSLFKNRFLPEGIDSTGYKEKSASTKLIVISDGDLARNEINPRSRQPQQLGFDPFTNYTFANEELIINAVSYLVDESGLISTRNKEVKIRPLDKQKASVEKVKWQILNLALPIVVMVLYGIIRAVLRKRKFSTF